MAPGKRRKRRDEIAVTIRPFKNLSDYKACTDIQREVWGYADIDIVPISTMRALDEYGGITLGAYNNLGEMVAFVSSMPGVEKGELLQHSHMLAVRRAYRNFNVGARLKGAQRKETIKQKVKTITWSFDPMQPMNAYFNLGKLAASTCVYKENFYGEMTGTLDRGLPTDRFLARWDIRSKRVEERLESGPPPHDLRKELKRYPVINRLEEVTPGVTTSSPILLNFEADALLFEVPYNLPDIKTRDLGVALEWQGRMRQVFRAFFKKDYAVTDFWVAEDEGHTRTFYFLERRKR